MKLVLVGPGALGTLLAARIGLFLSRENRDPGERPETCLWLFDHRQDRVDLLNRQGLLLEENDRQNRCFVRATATPDQPGPADLVLLCVKSHAVGQCLQTIAPLLTSHTVLLGMQNGIGHLEELRRSPAIPGIGVTSEGATLKAPGHVIHGGSGYTRLGFLIPEPGRQADRILHCFSQLLTSSGFGNEITASPLEYVWAKLFVNVAINALTAIHDQPNGWLLTSDECRNTMIAAVAEAHEVALALGVPVTGNPIDTAFEVCAKTAANISSMLQDVRKKRITEIDAINGAVVREGKRLGIPVPVNEDLVRRVRLLELSYAPSRA